MEEDGYSVHRAKCGQRCCHGTLCVSHLDIAMDNTVSLQVHNGLAHLDHQQQHLSLWWRWRISFQSPRKVAAEGLLEEGQHNVSGGGGGGGTKQQLFVGAHVRRMAGKCVRAVCVRVYVCLHVTLSW